MELLWVVLALLVLDLAAFRFAVDTRPGLRHTPRPALRRPSGREVARTPGPGPRVRPTPDRRHRPIGG